MSKSKGAYWERKLCEHLADMYGIEAERVPLSGALGGRHCHDVVVTSGTWEGKRFEVKYRKGAAGFSRLYEVLGRQSLPDAGMYSTADVYEALDAGDWTCPECYGTGVYADWGVYENPCSNCMEHEVSGEFKTLDKWMGTADVLALRAARKPWLFVYRQP